MKSNEMLYFDGNSPVINFPLLIYFISSVNGILYPNPWIQNEKNITVIKKNYFATLGSYNLSNRKFFGRNSEILFLLSTELKKSDNNFGNSSLVISKNSTSLLKINEKSTGLLVSSITTEIKDVLMFNVCTSKEVSDNNSVISGRFLNGMYSVI